MSRSAAQGWATPGRTARGRLRRAALLPTLALLAAVGCGLTTASAAAPPQLDLTDTSGAVRLGGHAEFLVDPTGELTVHDLRAASGANPSAGSRPRFQPLTRSALHQGLTTEAYWVRLRIPNEGTDRLRWALVADAAYIDHLDAWIFDSDGNRDVFDLSDRRPFGERPLAYRTLGLRHATPAEGYSDVYLRLTFDRLDTMTLGFRVLAGDAFEEFVVAEYFGYGLLYGALLVLSAYSLLVWRQTRDPRFGFYGAYTFCTAIGWMAVNGHLHQFVLPGWPELVNRSMHVLFLAVAITGLLFSRSFLRTAHVLPRTDRVLVGAVALLTTGILLRLLGFWTIPYLLCHLSLAMLFGLPFVGIAAWRRGVTYARWFVAAWFVYTGMFLLNFLHIIGVLSVLSVTQLYPLVQGLNLLEIVMLAVAQSDRIGLLQRDKRAAEQRHRDLLESHNEMLEQMVGERTQELATAWAQARLESETDEETGLGNRRFFLRAGRHALLEPRPGAHQALVYFDLDRFKRINDTHGHAAGDAILRAFAEVVAAGVRDDDLVARFGGEEFVLLLVDLRDVEESRQIVERICRQFREQATHYAGETIAHTVSAGIAIRPPASSTGLRTLLAHADLALYRAKDRGRDCVIIADGREPASGIGHPVYE